MREAITTWLELLGMLMIVAGAALWVAGWSIPAGLGTGGVLLFVVSGLITARGPRAKAPQDGVSAL